MEAIDKLHYVAYNLIHAKYNQRNDDGSNKHDDCTFEQLRPSWPGGLVPELGVALLQIRK